MEILRKGLLLFDLPNLLQQALDHSKERGKSRARSEDMINQPYVRCLICTLYTWQTPLHELLPVNHKYVRSASPPME